MPLKKHRLLSYRVCPGSAKLYLPENKQCFFYGLWVDAGLIRDVPLFDDSGVSNFLLSKTNFIMCKMAEVKPL